MANEVKKERPQNKNLKNLRDRTPEEARAIRSLGGKARQRQMREQMTMHKVAQAFMTLGVGNRQAVDPEILKSLSEAEAKSIPILMDLLMTEYQRYKETGDKESRDFLLRVFNNKTDETGINSGIPLVDVQAEIPGADIAGGVRIHLIRGDKPADHPQTQETTPTQDAAPGGEE